MSGQFIKHTIIIFQENKSFDCYFGSYPGADGAVNIGSTQPNGLGQNISPQYSSSDIPPDLGHDNSVALCCFDGGKMDGFITAQTSASCTKHPRSVTSASQQVMMYWDSKSIPYYWNWAANYTLCQKMFQSIMAPSFPQHLWLIGASSLYTDGKMVLGNPHSTLVNFLSNPGAWQDGTHGFNMPTILQEFDSAGITWKYYIDKNTTTPIWIAPSVLNYYHNSWSTIFGDTGSVVSDIQSGNLPQVTYIIPPKALSDHPPNSISGAQTYVHNIVQALGQSRYWQDCAIFVMHDDWGGFYDHVSPPQVDAWGMGFRVPCLVISPYSVQGFNNDTFDFTSTMKFLETLYGLPAVASRDGASNNMMSCFNFGQTPLPPPQ